MENLVCEQYKDDLKKFTDWISDQPRLPQNMKKLLLLRYLKVCNFDHDRAQKLLLLNLDLRQKNPHIFSERDLNSESIQSAIKTIQACPLPSYTNEKHKVTIFRFIDHDPSQYDVNNNFKMFFMFSDVRYITADSVGLTEGEIGIMDFTGFSFRHFWKVVANFSTIRLYLKYVQEAVPFRIHQNHFVNCSPMLTRVMTLIRPFVKKELFDVMHFHTAGYESLYDHIPREILPREYGGNACSIDDIFNEWLQVVEKHKEYLYDDLNWKLSE